MDIRALKPARTKPRIIIHGGAGNINRQNLSKQAHDAYRNALLTILRTANAMLSCSGASALDVATHAVELLELNPLFNAGRGAVYTTAGTHELEASVMVSRGLRKRGVGVMNVRRAKSPILLAKEMLVRGELVDGGGAQGHCQLQGETCDELAAKWGLETVKPSYFWTRRRWDEHRRGLGLSHTDEEYHKAKHSADTSAGSTLAQVNSGSACSDFELADIPWDGQEYLPQGTVGACALDADGVLCVCTSTGGLTNKLPGRIGDTPTLGAGFWAEEWQELDTPMDWTSPLVSQLSGLIRDCAPAFVDYVMPRLSATGTAGRRAVAMSGTGNGDSFLRVNAVRTAAAIARFSSSSNAGTSKGGGLVTLQQAISAIAGPNGELQRSAEDRWRKTGEGEGGIIGIEMANGTGRIANDFNCGGMFRAWVDDESRERFMVFRVEY